MVKELYNTDEIQSQKSLQDIVDTIRDFVKRNMAEMHQVQYDALSDFDEKADIAVCIKGDLGFFGGLRYLRFNRSWYRKTCSYGRYKRKIYNSS